VESQLGDKNKLIRKNDELIRMYRIQNESMYLEILYLNNMLNARGIVELFERRYFGVKTGKSRSQKWSQLGDEDEFLAILRDKHALDKDDLVSTVCQMYQ